MLVGNSLKRTYARAETSPGVPFDLTCTTTKRGRVRVSMRFSILYSGPGVSEDDYGIACDIRARVNGADILEETVGIGRRLHVPVDRHIGSFKWVNAGSVLGNHALKATVVLADLGVLEDASDIQFSGSITCDEYTKAGNLSLWIGT